jgi:GT2 family glycosyltransferase
VARVVRYEPRGMPDGVKLAPHVGVVVLHWGTAGVTARCLESLKQVAYPAGLTVFVIDNARSFDRARAGCLAPLEVEVHQPSRNLGFSAGSAWGIRLAMERGVDFILLLNNDAVVEPLFLAPLLEAARACPGAGLLCPHILWAGRLQRTWYGGGTFSLWLGIPGQARGKRNGLHDPVREVEYATGCAMLIDPAVIRAVGSFDPGFFAYCEDLELSLRARTRGFKILFVPSSVVHHAVTDETRHRSQAIYYSTRNLLEVMRRHAAWYQWPTFILSFLVRWIGFFTVLAWVRRRPGVIGALARGVADFARGRLGEREFGAPG